MITKVKVLESVSFLAIMCLQAIRCNIQEFCCNGLQGVTWSYMALQDHLVCVTAIFFTREQSSKGLLFTLLLLLLLLLLFLLLG
jgi:hypothetical protein